MKLVKILPAASLLLSASAIPVLAADIPVEDPTGLAAAVASAQTGDVLLLSANTTYTLTDQLVIADAITIRGAGIDSTIVKQTAKEKRIFILDNEGARIEGCTITGANVTKEINNGTKEGDGLNYGIAVTITTNGGTLHNCRVTGNTTSRNHNRCVGVFSMGAKGVITRCRIDNNKTTGGSNNTYGGVRLAGGTLEYCLVTDNKGQQTGGIGVLGACTVRNCVFYANEAGNSCGGNLYTETADAQFTDCIFAAGKCPESQSGTGRCEWAGTKVMTFNNCAFPTEVALDSAWKGTPFKCDARFFDLVDFASRLAPEATADIGWKPYDRSAAGCDFTLSAKKTRQNVAITATAVINAISNPSYVWTVTDPDGGQTTLTEASPEIATSKLGTYTVSLSVSGIVAPATASFVSVAPKVYPTTAAELMKACELSVDGEEIILTAQTYEITSALSLKTATTLRGEGRGKTVIRQKTTSQRVVLLDHPQALVEGITLVGKATTSEYAHGVVAYIGDTGGTIRNCDITGGGKSGGNWTHGMGVAMVGDGLIDHCFITNNVRTTTGVNMYGGGVYALKGTIESCLIANNASWNTGGGIHVGGPVTVRNSTIANNDILYSSGSGGGVYLAENGATFFNCIISDNRSGESDSATGKPDWGAGNGKSATFVTSVFPPTTTLDQKVVKGATTAVISFVSVKDGDYHMQGSSGTINAGTDDDKLPATDLDGVERVLGDAVDIGCFEADPYTFSASFTGPAEKVGFKGETNVYVAAAVGVKEGESVTFNWTVQTSDGRTLTFTGMVLELEMSDYGDWTVGMTATSGGKTASAAPVTYSVVPRVLYVKPPTPEAIAAAQAPYDSWDNAATNILDAIALALTGAEVRLAEGEFPVKARIDMMAGVSLVGQGWTKTTVRQTAKTTSILYLNHESAVVRGVTLTGLRAEAEIHSRGAVIIERNGGIVEDCRITGNVYTRPNENQASGIGITINSTKGVCRRCIIDRNKGSDGVNNCRGGGVQGYYGLLENCLVCCNTNKCAAGIAVWADFTVRNCTVVGNVATGTDNSYGQQGVAGIGNDGAGVSTECRIENTVFADNVSLKQTWETGGYPEWRQSSAAKLTFVNCCLTNGIAWPASAVACINGDPLFRNAPGGDFTLKGLSPCRNAGADDHIEAGATDLLGKPRLFGRHVDIGCYELQTGAGLTIIAR